MKSVRIRERAHDTLHHLADFLHALPDDHPLQIALRTYSLALSLALGPALLPFLTSRKARSKGIARVIYILRRELSPNAFASSITVGVAGGAAIRQVWQRWEAGTERNGVHGNAMEKLREYVVSLQDWQKAFLSNALSSTLAIALLHSRRRHATSVSVGRPSPTLDLSLLVLVRAMDSVVQMGLLKSPYSITRSMPFHEREERQTTSRLWSSRLDALVFWACSAR